MRAQALLEDSITVHRPTQHNGSMGLRSRSLSLKETAPASCPYHWLLKQCGWPKERGFEEESCEALVSSPVLAGVGDYGRVGSTR